MEDNCSDLMEKLCAVQKKKKQLTVEHEELTDKHGKMEAEFEMWHQRALFSEGKCKNLEASVVQSAVECTELNNTLKLRDSQMDELEEKVNMLEHQLSSVSNAHDEKCIDYKDLGRMYTDERARWSAVLQKYKQSNMDLENKISKLQFEEEKTSAMMFSMMKEQEVEIDRIAMEQKQALRDKFSNYEERSNINQEDILGCNVILQETDVSIQEMNEDIEKQIGASTYLLSVTDENTNDDAHKECASNEANPRDTYSNSKIIILNKKEIDPSRKCNDDGSHISDESDNTELVAWNSEDELMVQPSSSITSI